MIVEKISMIDALNMEMKELMDSYQQMLENMSKEELISEIGRLLVDKGILLNSRGYHIDELKSEIERLTEENESRKELLKIHIKEKVELREENSELQKLVDELKVALANTIEGNEELIEENEQVVKDTAKEILQEWAEVDKWTGGFNLPIIYDIAKRKGVEVE